MAHSSTFRRFYEPVIWPPLCSQPIKGNYATFYSGLQVSSVHNMQELAGEELEQLYKNASFVPGNRAECFYLFVYAG